MDIAARQFQGFGGPDKGFAKHQTEGLRVAQ
jgi:hypothetical protein